MLKLADLTLPKFVYLLGHGLIDAKHPGTSLAYIEIANKEGIDGVKKAQAEFAAGNTIDAVHAAHGLPPSPIKTMRDHFAAADKMPGETQADSLPPTPTKAPALQLAASSVQHDGTVAASQRQIS